MMRQQSLSETATQRVLLLFISPRWFQAPPIKGDSLRFGRVFGGTIYTGQKVRIMGPHYIPGKMNDLFEKSVQRTVLMMGRTVEYITDVPCGNIVGLIGVDQYLIKGGTISNNKNAHCIRGMKYSVSPVVRVAVEPKDPSDLPKLIDGLKKLSKSGPLVVALTEANGLHIIAGCGEFHVEFCVNDLEKKYASCEIKTSDPFVTYKESVTATSSQICLAKSANKHNRFYVTAEPLSDKLTDLIDAGKLGPKVDIKERQKVLCDDFGWDKYDARKTWAFGPDNQGANILFDATKGVQYLNEIRDSMESAFQWATKEGVIAEENMRGVRMNIVDIVMKADPFYRGGSQVIPTARRVYYAAVLTAEPRLQEPIFLAEITFPTDNKSGVYQSLIDRRGIIVEEALAPSASLSKVKAYLPIAESFGLSTKLKAIYGEQAFSQCIFNHWAQVPGDPWQAESFAGATILAIRKIKGLEGGGMLALDRCLDKL